MKVRNLLGIVVAGLLAATPAIAQDRGANEVAGSLSYNDIEDVSTTTIDLTYGRYLTEMHEIGVAVSYLEIDGGEESVDGTSLGAFYQLNFPMDGTLVPYLGIDVATIGGDLGDAYDLSYGATAGLKIYPYDNVGINVALSYEKMQAAEDFFEDADGTSFTVGLMMRF